MYTTKALDLFSLVAMEKALREEVERVNKENPWDIPVEILEGYRRKVVNKYIDYIDALIKEYQEEFLTPLHYIFSDGKPCTTIDKRGEVEDYLLIEYSTEYETPYFEVESYKTRERVEEAILSLASLFVGAKDMIVLHKGTLLDFEITLDKYTLKEKVKWFEE